MGWVVVPAKESICLSGTSNPPEAVQLQSREQVNQLIDCLRQTADEVWPASDPLDTLLKTYVVWAGSRRGKAAELAQRAADGSLGREDRVALGKEIQALLRAARKPPMALLAGLSEVVGP